MNDSQERESLSRSEKALKVLKNKARGACSRSSATPPYKPQKPYVAILSCSDSRVIPEDIFCAAAGEIFVVRAAGNVFDAVGLASLEFAVKVLKVPLIVVMGHHGCGAVKATMGYCLELPESGEEEYSYYKSSTGVWNWPSPSVMDLIGKIIPALGLPHPPTLDPDKIIIENARLTAKRLQAESAIIRQAVEKGDLIIQVAFYTMQGGPKVNNVKWLDEYGKQHVDHGAIM